MHALTAITALPIGGSSLAAVATAGGSSLAAVASAVASQPPLLASVYLASSVGAYCVRRGLIHSRSDGSPLGPAERSRSPELLLLSPPSLRLFFFFGRRLRSLGEFNAPSIDCLRSSSCALVRR